MRAQKYTGKPIEVLEDNVRPLKLEKLTPQCAAITTTSVCLVEARRGFPVGLPATAAADN